VVRVDKPLEDTLAFQSSVAQQVASEFSLRLAAAAAAGKTLPPASND
jgi:hypothetical protein